MKFWNWKRKIEKDFYMKLFGLNLILQKIWPGAFLEARKIYLWKKKLLKRSSGSWKHFLANRTAEKEIKFWLYFLIRYFFSAQLKKMNSHYEPISNTDEEYLDSCSSVELLQGIHNSYHELWWALLNFRPKRFPHG